MLGPLHYLLEGLLTCLSVLHVVGGVCLALVWQLHTATAATINRCDTLISQECK